MTTPSDLFNTTLRALHNYPKLRETWDLLEPTISELQKVLPLVTRNLKELIPDIFPSLRSGIHEPASFSIEWVQTALNKLHYYVDIDNNFGDKTSAAVAQFQLDKNLHRLDGWPDLATCLALHLATQPPQPKD